MTSGKTYPEALGHGATSDLQADKQINFRVGNIFKDLVHSVITCVCDPCLNALCLMYVESSG